MKVLLVYPATPETFWSFKHVLFRRSAILCWVKPRMTR